MSKRQSSWFIFNKHVIKVLLIASDNKNLNTKVFSILVFILSIITTILVYNILDIVC